MVQLYWKFVNTVIGSRKLSCDVHFIISQEQIYRPPGAGVVPNIEDNRNMKLSYRFSGMDCLFSDNNTLSIGSIFQP